ncbi:hypothetical protein IAT38_000468 [Cryptococcus sp. DSM 104549]
MAYLINRHCDIDDCVNTTFGDEAVCSYCPPRQIRSFQYTLAWLDPPTIIQQAQSIRPGYTCNILIPSAGEILDAKHKMLNSVNLHLLVIFDDGVKWLLRARAYSPSNPPAELRARVTESEVATLQFLKAQGVKVPMAWMPPALPQPQHTPNDYFFMEYITNGAVLWPDDARANINESLDSPVTLHLIDNLAQHFISVSNAPVPARRIGSIYPGPVRGSYAVGPLCTMGFLSIPSPPYLLGPFKTQRERYLAHFDSALEYIYSLECDLGPSSLKRYIWLSEARKLVAGCVELAREETEFYVKHGEDWLKQYLSDEKGNLTGVVDWEWAFVATKAEAFAALHDFSLAGWKDCIPQSSLTGAELLLISAYERHGRPDLAACVRRGRLYQYINRTLSQFTGPRIGVINGLHKAILGEETGEQWDTEEDWERDMAKRHRDDSRAVDVAWRMYSWGEKSEYCRTEMLSIMLESKLGYKLEVYVDDPEDWDDGDGTEGEEMSEETRGDVKVSGDDEATRGNEVAGDKVDDKEAAVEKQPVVAEVEWVPPAFGYFESS